MARCEDFPCCGHAAGDCPDEHGRFTCVGCRKRLPRNSPSSYCRRCLSDRAYERPEDSPSLQDGGTY